MIVRDMSIDIETISTRVTAAILSIGVVEFNRYHYTLGRKFYTAVTAESAQAIGGHVETSTQEWWGQQSAEARAVFADPAAKPIQTALADLHTWMREGLEEDERVLLWGNGPGFDNAILRETYCKIGQPAPWRYSGDRDLRTILDLVPEAGFQVTRVGTHHNALDDAMTQALTLVHAFRLLHGKGVAL